VKWDGSFHEIKVKVAAPGAEVRTRTGYCPARAAFSRFVKRESNEAIMVHS